MLFFPVLSTVIQNKLDDEGDHYCLSMFLREHAFFVHSLVITSETLVTETDVTAGRLISERRCGSLMGEERKARVLVTSW